MVVNQRDQHPRDVVRDPVRLAAVRATGLVDHPPIAELQRLTAVARAMLGAAATFVSIVEERRDFYLSENGFGEPLQSERSVTGATFCHLAIQTKDPLVIRDTSADPVHRAIPTVQSLGVASYLGVPIRIGDDHHLGAFCAIDERPRDWSATEVDLLVELAASAERWVALYEIGRHLARVTQPMPYCMHCHRVTVDDQHWERLVDVLARSGVLVSHGYCPTCAAALDTSP